MGKTTNKSSNVISQLNQVEGFDASQYAIDIEKDGAMEKYLEVKYRRIWFRLRFPEGIIRKRIISMDGTQATVEARVYADKNDPDESYLACGYARRKAEDDPIRGRFLEIAETAAEGRALAGAGFGIQFGSELDDDEKGQMCDAPYAVPGRMPGPAQNSSPMPASSQGMAPAADPSPARVTQTATQTQNQGSPRILPVSGAGLAGKQTIPAHPVSEDIRMDETNRVQMPESYGQMPEDWQRVQNQQLPKEWQTAENQQAQTTGNPQAQVAENPQPAMQQPQAPLQKPESPQVSGGSMTIEQASAVVCNFGKNKGKTLGQIAMIPNQGLKELEWIAYKYGGRDENVRTGARMLLEAAAALAKAS